MPAREPRKESPVWISPQAAIFLSLFLTLVLAIVDLLTPGDVMLPITYAIPLVLGAAARSPRFLWGLTTLLVALTFGLYFAGQPVTHDDVQTIALANRGMTAGVLLLVAGLLHFGLVLGGAFEGQRLSLEEQNHELESMNEELGQREEEVVRQNEELQSQTEELERQSEELRVTNEELADREKMLEQLLELSRSLSTELSRNEVLQTICEALGGLTSGCTSAILVKDDDHLSIPCHHGFGPEGLASTTIGFDGSFSSLIMSLGQTGYLEDVTLRPDLHVPQPRNGPAPRSVLSCPLRVHGRCVGAIEIYSAQRQTWSEAQIAMLESLSAQASISIQSAEAVEAIRQERRRFESAFRTVPFGLIASDDQTGNQVRMNPAAAAMFGLPLDENIALTTPTGARLKRYFFRNDAPLPEERLPLVRALRGEEIQGEEIDLVFPNGKRFVLLASAAPIYDRKGQVAGAVAAFADITMHKQLQREIDLRRREAEEASVRKTRFLASVSHDIRTPVNAINLMAEVIRRSADNPSVAAQIPQMAQRLQANALALADLVTDVLDIARFDTGKVEIQESEFSLGDLLAEECRHLFPLAQDKGLQLTLEPLDRPIWLRTDRVKLARVIGNLIGNAVKFTDQGTVRVSAATDVGRQVLIRVADTGIGIPPEFLQHIFDEFTQLRNPERDREKGTGLGLTICKRLVEIMGGRIEVSSQVNNGSTFTIVLPSSIVLMRLEPGAEPLPVSIARTAQAPRRAELAGLKILLVEDHAATRETAAQILMDEGASVCEAGDGATALRLLGEGPWDVILLDMMLPDMDGREILRAIVEQRPAGLRAVIVMTGDLTSERLEEVKQLGADAFIGKPIDVNNLIEMLQTLRKGERGA
jgi:PAS domain S-box-containing protein